MTVVVFDLDNTLIESRIDFGALRSTLAAALPASVDPARLSIGELVTLAPVADRARLWALVERYETDGMRDAGAVDGALEVLDALRRRGCGLAVLTNNSRSAAGAALQRAALAEAVDVVFSRDDAPMKPDPAGIALIRARLGPNRPCVLVGDSWLDGVAARRAGVPFVAFRPRPEALALHRVEPVRVIGALRELLDLLR